MPSRDAANRHQQALDMLEYRAREIAGANHSRGCIPARCWRQAIAETFLGEPIRDPEWAEKMIERWRRDV